MHLFSAKRITGLNVFIFGLAILFKTIYPSADNIYIFLILLFILSLNFIIISIVGEKRKKLIIPGIIILLLALFIFIYVIFIYKFYSFRKIWPVLGFIPSIALIFYYIISASKSPSIIIPGIFIGIISMVILIKNLGIMQINFLNFTLLLISLMLVIIGLFLLFQKKIEVTAKNKLKVKNKK